MDALLKVYDAKEQDWEWDEEDYQSIIPENVVGGTGDMMKIEKE